MKQKYITANIRMPAPDWMQVRAAAGEVGMSINAYVNYLIRSASSRMELGVQRGRRAKASIWKLGRVASRSGKGLSGEDATIYE